MNKTCLEYCGLCKNKEPFKEPSKHTHSPEHKENQRKYLESKKSA